MSVFCLVMSVLTISSVLSSAGRAAYAEENPSDSTVKNVNDLDNQKND